MEQTITKEIELINLEGYKFLNEKGQVCTLCQNGNYKGFLVNGKIVAKTCKSAGGSTLPMIYEIETAKKILKDGFIVEELAFCEPISIPKKEMLV